jgi:hypothetical protein
VAAFSRGANKWRLSVEDATYSFSGTAAEPKLQKTAGPPPPIEMPFQSVNVLFDGGALMVGAGKKKQEFPLPVPITAVLQGADGRLYVFVGQRQAILDASEFSAERLAAALSSQLVHIGDTWGTNPTPLRGAILTLTRPSGGAIRFFCSAETNTSATQGRTSSSLIRGIRSGSPTAPWTAYPSGA